MGDPCRVVAVLGTRPEAIKLAPVIRALRSESRAVDTRVVVTGQHREMLDQVLSRFRITPDADLDVMRPNQRLGELTGRILHSVEAVLSDLGPDLLIVQGDTTTAFVTTLAGFYHQIPVGHVEAGLRTYDLGNPFPEEANRRLISVLADLHFAPTQTSAEALVREGIPPERIGVTGNTVVDALETLLDVPCSFAGTPLDGLPFDGRRVILVTSHRRESWGQDLENICLAIRDIVEAFPDVAVVYPVHLNPNVRSTVERTLAEAERVYLTEPLDYLTFINLARKSLLILTDSGGIQEEAPTLRKPVLLLRRVTERPEAFLAGRSSIVGTSRAEIVRQTSRLLSDASAYRAMTMGQNPYGDGRAAERIVHAIRRWRRGQLPLLPPEDEFRAPGPPEASRGRSLHETSLPAACSVGPPIWLPAAPLMIDER
jgi:UDP-N-acetylglucosamine 2-epimerase (non-hydrolysing)